MVAVEEVIVVNPSTGCVGVNVGCYAAIECYFVPIPGPQDADASGHGSVSVYGAESRALRVARWRLEDRADCMTVAS